MCNVAEYLRCPAPHPLKGKTNPRLEGKTERISLVGFQQAHILHLQRNATACDARFIMSQKRKAEPSESMRLNKLLAAELRKLARKRGAMVTWLLNKAVEEFLRHEKQSEVKD